MAEGEIAKSLNYGKWLEVLLTDEIDRKIFTTPFNTSVSVKFSPQHALRINETKIGERLELATVSLKIHSLTHNTFQLIIFPWH